MTKVCFKCLRDLPVEQFYRHSMMADGHLSKCKDCSKRDVAAARRARLEQVREYDRERSQLPHRRENVKRIVAREKTEFPERLAARQRARRAHTVVPDKCDGCNGVELQLQRHHPDYSHPTLVLWLCKPCHCIADRIRRVLDAVHEGAKEAS